MFKMTIWTPNPGFTGKPGTALELFDNFEPSVPTEVGSLDTLHPLLLTEKPGSVIEIRFVLDGDEQATFLRKCDVGGMISNGCEILSFVEEAHFDPKMAGGAVGLTEEDEPCFAPHELN